MPMAPSANISASQTVLRELICMRTLRALSEVNRLHFEIILQTFDAAFSSNTGLLESAERHFVIDDQSIHRHAARTHAARDLISNAARALATARSISPGVPSGNVMISSSVTGEMTDKRSFPRGGVHLPSTKTHSGAWIESVGCSIGGFLREVVCLRLGTLSHSFRFEASASSMSSS